MTSLNESTIHSQTTEELRQLSQRYFLEHTDKDILKWYDESLVESSPTFQEYCNREIEDISLTGVPLNVNRQELMVKMLDKLFYFCRNGVWLHFNNKRLLKKIYKKHFAKYVQISADGIRSVNIVDHTGLECLFDPFGAALMDFMVSKQFLRELFMAKRYTKHTIDAFFAYRYKPHDSDDVIYGLDEYIHYIAVQDNAPRYIVKKQMEVIILNMMVKAFMVVSAKIMTKMLEIMHHKDENLSTILTSISIFYMSGASRVGGNIDILKRISESINPEFVLSNLRYLDGAIVKHAQSESKEIHRSLVEVIKNIDSRVREHISANVSTTDPSEIDKYIMSNAEDFCTITDAKDIRAAIDLLIFLTTDKLMNCATYNPMTDFERTIPQQPSGKLGIRTLDKIYSLQSGGPVKWKQ